MDIGSLYTDYYRNQASDAVNKKVSTTLKNADLSGASDEELMDVCKQFESYFVEQILKKTMDAFTDGDDYSSASMSTLTNYFKDNLMQEYAQKISDQQDLGLAKTLYEQMKRNYAPSNIKAAEEESTPVEETPENDIVSAVESIATVISKNE